MSSIMPKGWFGSPEPKTSYSYKDPLVLGGTFAAGVGLTLAVQKFATTSYGDAVGKAIDRAATELTGNVATVCAKVVDCCSRKPSAPPMAAAPVPNKPSFYWSDLLVVPLIWRKVAG